MASPLEVSGDDLIDSTQEEECDDANNANVNHLGTDGCVNCVVHVGWYCFGGSEWSASRCREICGDGIDFYNY